QLLPNLTKNEPIFTSPNLDPVCSSVSNDRRGPGGGLDSVDSTGATWQASVTASLRPTSALAGGGSAVQQLSEHLARLSDATLDSLSSESLRRVSSWSETQEKKQLKRCGEKQVRRCNFIYELVSTELSHLRNIRVLRAVFRDPLRQFFNGDVDRLFPHLDELERLHTCLLRDLRDCDPPADRLPNDWPGLGRVGAVLRRHLGEPRGADWLRAYGGFCSEHTLHLQKAPAGIAQRWPEFADLLQQCERSPWLGGRHCRSASTASSRRRTRTCRARCQDLDRLLEGVNATVESSHNRHLLERIAAGFQPSPEQSGLSADQLMSRSLLHSGHLKLQTSEMKSHVPCFAVLLNDMLVFLQELPGDRYSPLACPSRYVPVIHFSETDAIVRENESGKSKATFFIIIKKPDPALINLACMSLEERNKWLRRINQVRDSNPRADERAVQAEKRLREKSKVSAELLASMEAKDRELRGLLNEKGQLWKQLLGLWGPSEPAALPEEGSDPDQLLCQALRELDSLRRLLHSAPAFAAGASENAEASGGSLTRSASNAEDKATSSVSLPKRADTFSGYDSRQQRPPASAVQDESLNGSDILLAQQPQPSQTPQPAPTQSKSATTASSSTSLSVKARRKSVAADAVSELFGSREKTRRPSVFELMFKRPQRDAQGSSVSEEDSGGSDQELRQPDAAGLVSLDRLHSLVNGLCRDLLAARTRLADKFKEEARLRQELQELRAARETEGHRSQDSLLETIRLQRAELDAEKARFRDSQRRELARLETRKEDLERKEEAQRQRQEELERQQASLTEQKRTLQMQFDQYNSMRMQHAKSFSDDFMEPPPQQQQHPAGKARAPSAAACGSGSLTVSSAKGHSKSTSNLAPAAAQPQVPPHLTSRLIEDRQARENGAGPALTSPTQHTRLSPSASRASGGGVAQTALPPQLPLHLASDSKKRKSTSVFKVLRRNGESDSTINN
uniref:DH domain-containing protein n=1 Tax=Macrostomum lignano TaxID=282301 RepID=A0A1I8ISI3_9PLAT